MAIEIRAVVDTNVVVSAVLLPQSIPRRAFDLAAQNGSILLSEATLQELESVLRRPKFDRYVTEQARLEFLWELVSCAEIVPVSDEIALCRDPKDNKFLELAVSGKASHIVSGDADILGFNPFRGIAVVTPEFFL